MLQEVIELQNNAVDSLIKEVLQKDEITFKSPTGSGKTYMMADFMNRVLAENTNVVFLVSSLSKGNLAEQNYNKFVEYSQNGFFDKLDPYLISSEIDEEERLFIPLDYNVYILPRDLYKKGGRLMQGAMQNFLDNLTLDVNFLGKGKKVYLIKDECHIATNNLDNLSQSFFEKIINMSATPNLRRGQNPDVEITEEDAVKTKLIKHVELGNEEDTVADAICKFETIKDDYRNLLGVNPCLIIQISNKDKADYEINNIIMPVLNKAEHQDLKWMLIVDNDKECDTNDEVKAKKIPVSRWKDYAKSNSAMIDIIIFKMVITEGWDIPRACMLYQIRDSQSKQLDEQVMGRVRRNPRLLDFEKLSPIAQDLATTSWIWGILPDNKNKTISVKLWDEKEDITNNFKIKTTRLLPLTDKANFDLDTFINGINNHTTHTNIFKLWKKEKQCDDYVRNLSNNYSQDFQKWLKFVENIDSISAESKKFACDYNTSMVLFADENGSTDFSLPENSFYIDKGNYVNISDWIWKRKDGKEKFSFDSEAEKEWAEILKELSWRTNRSNERAIKKVITGKNNPNYGKISFFGVDNNLKVNPIEKFLWGKNYLINSNIKFEYYSNSNHFTYPDFVLKDSYDRIHIFEVKSVNESSNNYGLDFNEYANKISDLRQCYRFASKITSQIFYIPILNEDTWQIFKFENGTEETLTKEQLFSFITNGVF